MTNDVRKVAEEMREHAADLSKTADALEAACSELGSTVAEFRLAAKEELDRADRLDAAMREPVIWYDPDKLPKNNYQDLDPCPATIRRTKMNTVPLFAAPPDDKAMQDVLLYRLGVRGLHWSDGSLCVTHSKNVKPGSDCPSGERLDAAIKSMSIVKEAKDAVDSMAEEFNLDGYLRRKTGTNQMKEACFSVIRETAKFVVLKDLGPWDVHPTITNDAELVVHRIAPRLCGRRLAYYDSDSDGDLGELLVENGKFAGFAPLAAGEIE